MKSPDKTVIPEDAIERIVIRLCDLRIRTVLRTTELENSMAWINTNLEELVNISPLRPLWGSLFLRPLGRQIIRQIAQP